MFKSLMVPLDGFDYAEQALPHALALARRAGAQVHLVHVLDMLMRPPYAERVPSYEWWNGAAIDCARDYLRVQWEKLVAAGVDGTHTVLTGKPAEALVEEAKRRRADLIVMATHGRGPLRRLWLGSVADQLSRTAGRPIMFVRVSDQMVPVPPPRFSSILVALDGSTVAEGVLDPALELARLDRATITLLHVTYPESLLLPIMPLEYAAAGAGVNINPLPEERTDADYLAMVAESISDQGVPVHTDVRLSNALANAEIVNYARTNQVDLIALATQGRGVLRRVLAGSVSDRTLQQAEMPVLLLASEKH